MTNDGRIVLLPTTVVGSVRIIVIRPSLNAGLLVMTRVYDIITRVIPQMHYCTKYIIVNICKK